MNAPCLIGLDWGTSSLRAYLMGDDGHVLEQRAMPRGILRVPGGDFAATFAEVTEGWHEAVPGGLPQLACGMIGSAQGWREVPYVRSPADVATLSAGLANVLTASGSRLHIVPGVRHDGPVPSVLRGEETQIVGALVLRPSLAERALLVLPGTHSKWVEVRDGAIGRFETYMAGELFALLREHSILGRPARDAGAEARTGEPGSAFERGVDTVRDSGRAGVMARLFSARSLVLTGALAAVESLDYLSGMLIGEELRSALTAYEVHPLPAVTLIADPLLCRLYRRAFARFDLPEPEVVEDAASMGLWHIACTAGLVDAVSVTDTAGSTFA
ncbi:2-dehydro-3-deoxygalactonokinase [Vitiosangium sp. GDMCC 1.1324]|uniref:2-dehydro-3-deoxygalactonokinase n=1 Tax=Vitiosangium sp. (strain GDMCC 1.1324) TaxID=2138576 RepID=UPI000D344B8A|nr:2-dehydro-3-deoxygalactonokinase [Vitiosangium sp. GDMCC 1.1324]PTL85728.1 2-keto-3-deoxy-galactonokinase [Vitiosangium sp. GDMCC 1.1324]